jgi:hypothetical protein
MFFFSPERVHTEMMQRLTRTLRRIAPFLARGGLAYFGVNLLLLAEEAHYHLIFRLMLWDVSQLKLFGFLLSKTLHP